VFPEYDIYHPNLMKSLENPSAQFDPFFCNFIEHNFNVFARFYKCEVKLSTLRTIEAKDNWHVHRARWLEIMRSAHGSTGLDHYKLAGLLTFWLRRRIVVERVLPTPYPPGLGIEPDYLSPLQETFLKSGNEICSFLIGYHLCVRFELDPPRIELASFYMPDDFVESAGTMLHQKEISPDGLYMMFKGLFLHMSPGRTIA
jgi:hypothetical protein